jgi:AcrR family transcriptional regulator
MPSKYPMLTKSKRVYFWGHGKTAMQQGDDMVEDQEETRIRKGELARQRLLASALHLFRSRGYEETTMREIAAEAGYSPGLTYRYFSGKEELVMLLYQQLAEELESYASSLPPVSLAERFYATLAKLLELMTPHHETLIALFGTALNPRSKVGVLSESTADLRRKSRAMYLAIIEGATDAPRVRQRQDLATALYGVHLALVFFWLIDQSVQAQRTQQLLALLRDLLKLLQPLLRLPVVAHTLMRLARILGPLLGADEPVHQDPVGNR